jgi:hypothetical protein
MEYFVLFMLGFGAGAALVYALCIMAVAAGCRACRQRMTSDRLRHECDVIDSRDAINTALWWSDDAQQPKG